MKFSSCTADAVPGVLRVSGYVAEKSQKAVRKIEMKFESPLMIPK